MSKKKKSGDEAGGEKKSKKKLIIMIVAVLAIGGGVYKFALAPKPPVPKPSAGEVVKMDPTIVNLNDGHYLKVGFNIVLVKGKGTAADWDTSAAQQMVISTYTGQPRANMTKAMRLQLETSLEKELKADKDYKGQVYAIYYNQFLID